MSELELNKTLVFTVPFPRADLPISARLSNAYEIFLQITALSIDHFWHCKDDCPTSVFLYGSGVESMPKHCVYPGKLFIFAKYIDDIPPSEMKALNEKITAHFHALKAGEVEKKKVRKTTKQTK